MSHTGTTQGHGTRDKTRCLPHTAAEFIMEVDLNKIKKRFPLDLELTFVEDNEFYLSADFVYQSPQFGTITCPSTYLTDGASIPHWSQFIVGSPWSGKYPRAAVIHDWLCSSEGEIIGSDQRLTKKETDQVFLEMMKFLGVGFFRRRIMYSAVRLARWNFEWEKKAADPKVTKAALQKIRI